MYYLSVASSDLCCAYLCHFFMPFAFQARGLCLHCWYLSMIKYLVTFKLKQQDIPENNCGSIFSIGLIIICRLNNYKEQVMPHGKCGLDWIFSVQITGLEETFLCSYKFIQLCSPPPAATPRLSCEKVEGGVIKVLGSCLHICYISPPTTSVLFLHFWPNIHVHTYPLNRLEEMLLLQSSKSAGRII